MVTFILSKVSTLISNAISALTKNDVGLGNLDNIQQATKEEFNTHDTDGIRHITAGERSAWGAKWDYNESTIKDVKVNNASDADTVNGKTVAVNVPAGAKFTDTTYTPATTSADGLMAKEDKTIVDFISDLLSDDDPDFIDTLAEILDVFATYPEGVDIMSKFAEKVDKETGKGLSANDFTTTLKDKLDNIAEGANNYTLPSASATVLGGVKIAVVEELPSSPDPDVFYFIPE